MAIELTKAPRKPRVRKPKPETLDQIEAALVRLINPPVFVCGSTRTVDGVDWNVTLFSDDTVRISVDGAPVATGRFMTETSVVSGWSSLSVVSRIVDVVPAEAVAADIVEFLAGDLTYFAMRAGRFSGVRS
jgi:hypothetical protein